MRKIVMIEDDTDICDMISKFLEDYQYKIYCASNGSEGIKVCQNIMPELILLDLMLPALSGSEVLKQIRRFTDCPVIVVSAKSMVQSKVELLRMGADDYMTKPFDLYELLARIEANLKRSGGEVPGTDSCLSYKDIEIKCSSVYINQEQISFTATELEIMKLLLRHPKKVFSKQNLYESIWHEDYAYDNDTINTHMSNIRKKIKSRTNDEYIETVWGIGYKLK